MSLTKTALALLAVFYAAAESKGGPVRRAKTYSLLIYCTSIQSTNEANNPRKSDGSHSRDRKSCPACTSRSVSDC